MDKHSVAKVLIRGVFIVSLFFAIFSAIQITTADSQIEASLKEWEKLKDKIGEEDLEEKLEDVLDVDKLVDHSLFSLGEGQSQQAGNKDKQTKILEEEEGKVLDNNYPTKGELIGKIIIPTLEKELPIIHGTDSKQLAQGVGHYIGSVLPGESNNSVLAGHRDTVFRGLGKVQIGDSIYIETAAGLFTYEIEKQQIVDSSDRTIIVPYEEATVTLITCYPFDFIGNAPKRYILTGRLVQ